MITADVIKFCLANVVTFVAGFICHSFVTSKQSASEAKFSRKHKRFGTYTGNTMQRLKDKPYLSGSSASPFVIPKDLSKLLNKKDRDLTTAEYHRVATFVCEAGEALVKAHLPAWVEIARADLRRTDRCIAVDIVSHDYVFGETCSDAAVALKKRKDKARIYVTNVEDQLLSPLHKELLFAGR